MASIYREIPINAPFDLVWDAVRDVGEVHRKLVPGIVVATRLEAGARVVTFADGMVVRELIVDVNEELHRVAYASVGGRATHHNASMRVLSDCASMTRVLWITDVLPHELAGPIGSLVALGAEAMKRTLEARAAADGER